MLEVKNDKDKRSNGKSKLLEAEEYYYPNYGGKEYYKAHFLWKMYVIMFPIYY